MNTKLSVKPEFSPEEEIDADLAEILNLLSTMMSSVTMASVGASERYLGNHCSSLRHLTRSNQVEVWVSFERGASTLFALSGRSINDGELPIKLDELTTRMTEIELGIKETKK